MDGVVVERPEGSVATDSFVVPSFLFTILPFPLAQTIRTWPYCARNTWRQFMGLLHGRSKGGEIKESQDKASYWMK